MSQGCDTNGFTLESQKGDLLLLTTTVSIKHISCVCCFRLGFSDEEENSGKWCVCVGGGEREREREREKLFRWIYMHGHVTYFVNGGT